jgi:putative ABC transport system permease protein
MSLVNFVGMALRNIRNGGQRMVVALLCIMFGVMSLVGMATVAERMGTSILSDPRFRMGGDLELSPDEEFVTPEHLAGFEELRASGQITAYMPLSKDYSVAIRTQESGELQFIDAGMGIDPQLFPLVGDFVLQEPVNAEAAGLLRENGDVLLTRDLAQELALNVGDTIHLGNLNSSVAIEAPVRGIVGQTPDGYGSRVYYDLGTAELLAGNETYLDTVVVTAPDPASVQALYEERGWWAFPLEGYAATLRDTQEMFDLTLKGAGILGLLVAGIGIANTMQVLLARRTREIAIFKTLGYSQRDMLALFMLEAGVLGVTGSALGVVAGVLISRWLVVLLSRTTTFMLDWAVHPPTLVLGLLVGIVTTLIFAMLAIVRASNVRPLSLLRNETVAPDVSSRLKTVGLWVVLAIPFTLVTTVIMESVLKGIGIVLFALAGLLVIGGVFALLVKLLPRLIPSRPFPLLGIALGSLRRRGLSLVFAMIALFVGTVTLTMAAVITQGAQRELDEEIVEVEGYDLTILAPAGYEAQIEAAVSDQPVVDVGYELTVRQVTAPGVPDRAFEPMLSGQAGLTGMTITMGPTWEEQVHGVYVYEPLGLRPGAEVEVELLDGRTVTLPVVGTYDIDFNQPSFGQNFSLLMHPQTLLAIAEPERVTFNLDVPDAQLDTITTELGQALPEAIVINRYAYMNRFAQNYRNLFVFAVAMAGLALLAGVLLVANAVSLGMISRRYEIGVLKAVGYTRSHILRMLAVEYSLSGIIAAIAGVIATVLILVITAALNDTAGNILTLNWSTAALMPVVTVLLTLLTVLIAAWKPTQLPPVTVLAAQE